MLDIKKLVFATHNTGKVIEMKNILAGLNIELLTAEEAGVYEDVEEDQDTFEGNAYKKAKFITDKIGEWAVADDSGVVIEALGGEPGVYSARWAGENAGASEIVDHTLKQMKNIKPEDRRASFISVLVLTGPNNEKYVFEGEVEGSILEQPIGECHPKLPYDVIFKVKSAGKAFSEMSGDEKNSLSHRGLAFKKMREFLENN